MLRPSARDVAAAVFSALLIGAGCVPPTEPPVEPGDAPAAVVFETQPSSGTSGVALAPAVTVRLVNAGGATVTTATNSVTLAIVSGTGAAGAQLTGTLTVNAIAGVATFDNLRIDKAGTGYQLTATSGSLSSATSSAFAVSAAAAARLAFAVSPSAGVGGGAVTPTVQVAITDAAGNTVTSATNVVTLALAGNSGAALTGTTSAAATNGVATFNALSIDKAGTGYQLAASATGLTGATSSVFNVQVGPAARILITTQPANAIAGQSFGLAATIQDAGGNTVATATNSLTAALTIGTGAAGASLQGSATVAAVNGVATFTGLSIDKPGSGYTLTLTSSGLPAATSAAFNVTVGAPAALRFSEQPSAMTSGSNATFKVEIVDAHGNVVPTASNAVTIAISSGTGATGATLGGTLTATPMNGVVTFGGITIDKAGAGYRLSATASGLTVAQSQAFDVSAGPASRLVFSAAPTSMAVGVAGNFQVRITDAAGNTVTSATNAVTVAIASGTGTNGAVLGGALTVNAVAGVATFSNLSVDRVGAAYKLSATSGTLTSALSPTFNVTGTAAATFSAQPASSVAGASLGGITVTLLDATGSVATGSSAPVTVSIASGTGAAGAALGGTTTVNAVNGVATFSNLSIAKAATGYQLTASAATFAAATSSTFDVAPAAAAKLAFSVHPTDANVNSAIAPAIRVSVLDAFDNLTAATGAVTLSIAGGGTAGAVLGGSLTVNAVAGVAEFSAVTVDRAGSAYVLSASGAGLTPAQSSAFDVLTTPALSFSGQPGNATAGAAIPTFTVTLRDGTGAVAVGSNTQVTLSIATNTGASGATLSGTTTVNAVNGVATFANVSIERAGTGYQLLAAAASFVTATSATFDVSAAAPAALEFTTQSAVMTSGQPATFVVAVLDAFGNATNATSSITLSIASGTGVTGATLGGTTTRSASGGTAQFTNITLDKAGTGYQLVAAGSALTSATSSSITVNPGAPTKLAFTVQPSNANANVAIAPAIQVSLLDAADNVATSATNVVTLAIAPGTGTSGASLSGSSSVAAVAGVATFGDLAVSLAGADYRLDAAATGLTSAQSATFDIGVGVSAGLAEVVITPASGSVAVNGTLTLQAVLRDAQGNETPISPVWATSNPGRATVSSAGVVTGLSAGTVTISATHAGLIGRATITITP